MTTLPNPQDLPLYNSKIIDNYIKLINKKYNDVDIPDLLSYAGMEKFEIDDAGHYFTQDHIDRFHERLSQVTRYANISREAGRFATSPEAMGAFRQYVFSQANPAQAFALAGRVAKNLTRSSTWESKRIASGKAEIVVTPNEGANEKPFQCENRMGIIESVILGFSHKLPQIYHPECIFQGGDACRYVVTWERTRSTVIKRIRNLVTILLILTCIGGFTVNPVWMLTRGLPIAASIALALAFLSEFFEKRELRSNLSETFDATDRQVDRTKTNYNNALMVNEFGQAISKQLSVDDILSNVVQILESRLDYDRGIILLADPDKERLVFRAGFGYTKDQLELLETTRFHLNSPSSRGIFILSYRQQKPFLINDINMIEADLSPRSIQVLKGLGTQSFICCPIVHDEESIGILAVDNLKSKRLLVQSDISLLQGFAPVIGVSIRNAALLDTTLRQFNSIVQVMAASIDARDSLTAGHSERVTLFCMGVCRKLGLSEEFQEMVRIAALLHDYGKLAVPDRILKKPGRLTDAEYALVKDHPEKTREILEKIHFEGIFRGVPEVAASHHEKLDGSGYPRGLKGKDIPLGARIIGVADFFEAITSERHYRDPMPQDEAIDLLRNESGIHFDPGIVDAFLSYYDSSLEPDSHPVGDDHPVAALEEA